MVLKEIILLKVNMPQNFSGLSDWNGDLVRLDVHLLAFSPDSEPEN